jgi:SAM-dependent methyltransferase
MSVSFIDQVPVRIGTAKEFERVAEVLQQASFDEGTICRKLRLKDMSDTGWLRDDEDISPELRILIRLFFQSVMVPRVEVEQVFERATIDVFMTLGLLGTGEFGNDQYYARCWLYPLAGFLIASDRYSMPDGSAFTPPPDIAFPAIYKGSLQFLKLLPEGITGDVLDLCAGVGIGALVLSQAGSQVVSTDLSERATQFARFNCALNRRENIEVLRSDLYEAVNGRTFDCIVAHLPWITEVNRGLHDAYAGGESLCKRLVGGLTESLRPGGVCFALTQGRDTKEGKFEERVRTWLKGQADEFDILFAHYEVLTSLEILKSIARRARSFGPEAMAKLESDFELAGLSKMLFGGLYIRRHKTRSGEPWTARRTLSDATRGADVMSALILHDWISGPDSLARLLESRPQLAPGLQIMSKQVVHEAALVPGEFIFETDKPFAARDSFEAWTARVLARFDGQTTVANVFEEAQTATMPAGVGREGFVALIIRALEAGYLVLPEMTSLTAQGG